MFAKKRKERIKDQAWLLLQDCNDIITTFSEGMSCSEYLNNNPAKELKGVLGVIATCAYIVAGLNHAEAAMQMVEYFSDMVGRYSDDINPEKITPNEAKNIINGYYQNARGISDRLMAEGAGVGAIVEKQARAIFENDNIVYNEDDIELLTSTLITFYKETYSKYYG